MNRLTNLLCNDGTTTLASYYYQLGKTGNRTNLTETITGTNRSYAWKYDAVYRLTNENISGLGALGYIFDSVGNRTTRTQTGTLSLGSQSFGYNANDWLNTDTYDSNGNTLYSNTSTLPYGYDVENRLTNFNGLSGIRMTCNGDGWRTSKNNAYYLVDDRNPTGYPQVLEETDNAATPKQTFTYGLGLISVQTNGTGYFFGSDGHGSTRLLLNTDSSVAESYVYDAYGNLIGGPATPLTYYLYSGEQYDTDLGMYYLRARYYQPTYGRFWTMDTYAGDQADPLSLHKYLYCCGNPENQTDPKGEWPSKYGFHVHQQAVEDVLSFLPTHDLNILKDADAGMDDDQFQTSYFSYIHAMSSPVWNKVQARIQANAFVRQNIYEARHSESKGAHDDALEHLGCALHTLQDSTSPSHAGFQFWDGNWSDCGPNALLHVMGESYYKREGEGGPYSDALAKMTRQAYAYFKSRKALPSDFFWFNPPTITLNMLGPKAGFGQLFLSYGDIGADLLLP